MTARINFTKTAIQDLRPISQKDRFFVYDEKVRGLCIQVTRTETKTFYAYRKVNGTPKRVKLGRFPETTVEQARKSALKALSEMAQGIDPIAAKKAAKTADITLGEVFCDYISTRGHNLKEGTKRNYQCTLDGHLKDWKDKPLARITRDDAAKRHLQIGLQHPVAANNTMRILRALFEFANGQYEDGSGHSLFPDNPVNRITHTRSWNKEARRSNVIKNSELADWFRAVLDLKERKDKFAHVASDYLIFTLLTGLRRREAASLRVNDINFREQVFTVPNTKNSTPLTLPMSTYVEQLLFRRCASGLEEFVFPGKGANGHIDDPRRIIASVREVSGVQFTLHDLRRTFITIAESLDISRYAVKSLVNHSLGNDVTAGYINMGTERLRKPMQQITDKILGLAQLARSSTTVLT